MTLRPLMARQFSSLGTYNYLDGAYVGTSPAPNSVTEAAPLTGGTGVLTNGVAPTTDYTQGPQQYVGWKYTDPVGPSSM